MNTQDYNLNLSDLLAVEQFIEYVNANPSSVTFDDITLSDQENDLNLSDLFAVEQFIDFINVNPTSVTFDGLTLSEETISTLSVDNVSCFDFDNQTLDQLFNEELMEIGMFGGNEPSFKVIKTSSRHNIKFNCTEQVIELKIDDKQHDNFVDALKSCEQFFEDIYDKYIRNVNNNNKIRVVIEHPDFKHAINLPFLHPDQISPKLIYDHFERVVQSKRMNIESAPAQNVKVYIMVAHLVRGGHPIRQINGNDTNSFKKQQKNLKTIDDVVTYLDYLLFKKCVLKIWNKDNRCLLYAIVISIAYEKEEKNRKNFLRPGNKEIEARVNILAKRFNINRNTLCGIEELVKIEEYLQEYQITVVDANYSITESPIYLNKTKRFSKYIYLAYEQSHYFPITSMTAYLNKRYFCHPCKRAYSNPEDHICENVCKSCYRLDCEKQFSFP